MWNYNFYIYITTTLSKTTLYIGVTNDLRIRTSQHKDNRGLSDTFAGRYYCHYLVHYEHFHHIEEAIAREKAIKKWSRKKKIALIETSNPDWQFLNEEIDG